MSGKPTEQVSQERSGAGGGEGSHEQGLVPGAVLDHGRYRLLTQVGSDDRCAARLWRAKDGVLGRDVALTVLVGDRANAEHAANARRTLERAMHASTFNHVGVARVLDVVTQSPGDPECVLGLVIAEWTHGTDLLDLVAEGPLPPGTAARLLQPLAAAVEAAHHAGLVLGADHPQRIRVTSEGEIRMAFPGPLPHAGSGEDVRGLGATLYLLLTGYWALPGGPESAPRAPTDADGSLSMPRTLRPIVPLELSTVSVRALGTPETTGTTGGVRTGAAVLRVLEQYANAEPSSTVMQSTPAGSETRENELWHTEDPKPDSSRRRKLTIGVAVLTIATLVVLGWGTAALVGLMTGSNANSGPSVVLRPERTDNGRQQPAQPPPSAAGSVPITRADVFVTEQNRDNRADAGLVHDGDPSTHWNTDSYNDQFGTGFKNGIGLLLTLEKPATITEVTIRSPSPGTRVEIRAASSTSPTLESSRVIGTGTIQAESTRIPVKADEPTSHVLVWINKLSRDGRYSSRINEITVTGRTQ
ncbi:protein kinase family protein [Halopolyspora algeriensis]|uniref:protein kinase family protein n=1 Tax=Halopolyspora algeriensis TaxID=1500506 RepID=UPI000DF45038|nr:protein kinase family protein [Halopolyspora algeriensis]